MISQYCSIEIKQQITELDTLNIAFQVGKMTHKSFL